MAEKSFFIHFREHGRVTAHDFVVAHVEEKQYLCTVFREKEKQKKVSKENWKRKAKESKQRKLKKKKSCPVPYILPIIGQDKTGQDS